jgi:tetratricopeptide (TPR) repeat protein
MTEALLMLAELLSSLENRARDVINHLQRFLQTSKKPLGVDVTWSRVYEMLGDAYFKLGQYIDASETYETALHYNPYHPWEQSLYYRIARSYYQQNAYTEAIEAVERLMAAANADDEAIRDYRVYDVLGNAQFALGHYPEARQSYQNALQVAPSGTEGLEKIEQYLHLAQELS